VTGEKRETDLGEIAFNTYRATDKFSHSESPATYAL
jgi:hypothetical protein